MSLVELVGWSLIHSLWQGAVVALLLFGFLRLVDPRRSALRYLVSAFALLLVVVLPPITALRTASQPVAARVEPLTERDSNLDLNLDSNHDLNLDSNLGFQETNRGEKSRLPGEYFEGNSEASELDPNIAVTASTSLQLRLRALFPWLVAFWSIGVTLLSLRLLGAWLRARQLRIDGTSAVDPAYEKVLERLVATLGVLRPVRLLQSSILQVPAVIGWLRPVVLIPATLTSGLTIPQLEAILAHELAHIRRHDYLINLLQALVETLLFYHPAMWWISRQVRQEREHCCDDVAVRACGDRKLYAGALLTLEEHRALALLPSAAGGDLVARIRRIAAPRPSHAETAPRWLAGLIAVTSVLSIAATAAIVDPGKGELAAQNPPPFSERNAAFAPDTVIRHPDPDAPLAERWEWSRQVASTQKFPAFWVGYTIEPMPAITGTIYMGRLERRGITGSGGLNLRGRITNFGDFTGFNVPGVMLPPLIGGGMPDDVALLFAFVPDSRGRPVLARVHISSLALPVDLEDRPLIWLGDSDDEQSIPVVQALFAAAPGDLKQDVVAAVGVHGSSAAIPHLARWLEGSENNDVREEAAEWLGRHPDPEALALLARSARNDRVSDVRREAAEAVADMTLPAATDTLIRLARSLTDTDARREAVEGLSQQNEPRALAAAVEIARNDANIDVRREAVETLGEFKDGAGVSHLVEIARSERSADVRMEAVETLAEAGKPEEVIRVLRQIIEEDPSEDVAREAVETLGEVEDPAAISLLREFARNHPRPEVRKEAIETLAELDSGSETVSLLSGIAREDQNEEVQSEALESLGEMGVPEASNLVAEVARNHGNVEVRRRAVEMLVESLEPQVALEKLKDIVLHDSSVEVQVEATETLAELPASLAIPVLSDLAESHPEEEVRVEALESLGEVDSPRAIEVVVKVAEGGSSSETRREAIETIGERMDHASALKVLSRIARANDDSEIQIEAIETIGENLEQLGVDVLVDIARTHPNSEVRMEALESLTEMGAADVLEILVSAATSDVSDEVQHEAVEGLAELPDGAGVSALIRIARDHPNRELRSKALEALGESDDPRARAAINRMLEQ